VVVLQDRPGFRRSLMDFSRLVEVFDQHKVTFVFSDAVVKHYDVDGRLTLNILLSFAQFEREVLASASGTNSRHPAAGMWMGGWAPLGYELENAN